MKWPWSPKLFDHDAERDKPLASIPQPQAEQTPAKAEEKSNMASGTNPIAAVETGVEKLTSGAVALFSKAATFVRQAKAVWIALGSTANRALATQLLTDVLQLAADAEKAGNAGGLNYVLDSQLVADAKQIIADAKAGDPVIVADLKLLGITL